MKVSILIPAKNPGAIFKRVIDAVLNQSTDWEYDVLVIDSGSKDGTVEYVKSIPAIKLLEIPSHEFGHGRTRNLGISKTQGEFVVMLTHDALPTSSSWLSQLVKSIEQSDDVAGAFGRHIAYSTDGPFLERDIRMHFDGFVDQPLVKLDDQERYDHDAGYRQYLHFFSDNNACIRRSVWLEIPYPDVDFAEDQIWAKKIIEAGYKKAYANKATVYHSHHFGFIALCRRSFDESKALKKLFGYDLCPNLSHLFMNFIGTTRGDWKYLYSIKSYKLNWSWFFRIPVHNLFKQIGWYLGQRSETLPERLALRISRDHSIKKRKV